MSLKLHNFGNNLLSKSLLRKIITATITIYWGVISTDALAMLINSERTKKLLDKLLIAQSVDEDSIIISLILKTIGKDSFTYS